jgi:hypothetical protein
MDDNVSDPKGSKPYQTCKANFLRLMNLAKTLREPITDIVSRLGQETDHATATAETFAETLSTAHTGPYDSATFQKDAKVVLADLMAVRVAVADLTTLLKHSDFLGSWMLTMLVTFTEAYLQDALSLLLSEGLYACSLPPDISDEIKRKWIKEVLRIGKPSKWLKQLAKFGATGYTPNLEEQMTNIWDRRHQIIHSAEPEIDKSPLQALQEFLSAARVVNEFLETTDRFVVATCPHALSVQ